MFQESNSQARGSITITGADEHTPVASLADINAEIALLYTQTPEGRNRYPSRAWILDAASTLKRVAIHICGSNARRELLQGQMDDLLGAVQRIQVNGTLTVIEVETICAMYPTLTVITQHNLANAGLLDVQAVNHALLIDSSGGRGISPADWTPPATLKPVGFAGGLGPQNLSKELPRITAAARQGWWVDMEGKLRVDDWFSVPLARRVVAEFHARALAFMETNA